MQHIVKIDKKKRRNSKSAFTDCMSINTKSMKSTLEPPREEDEGIEEEEEEDQPLTIGEQLAQNMKNQKDYEKVIKKFIATFDDQVIKHKKKLEVIAEQDREIQKLKATIKAKNYSQVTRHKFEEKRKSNY